MYEKGQSDSDSSSEDHFTEEGYDTRHVVYSKVFRPLEEIMKSLKGTCQFYSSGTRQLPMPTIKVEGVDRLSFPIPAAQVQQLVAQAVRAPFGRGEETVTDLSVRKVWQLSPKTVAITGEHWNAAMTEILRKVRKLGGSFGGKILTTERFFLLTMPESCFSLFSVVVLAQR